MVGVSTTSTFARNTLVCPGFRDTNASSVPSGDHDGAVQLGTPFGKFFRFVPSAFTIAIQSVAFPEDVVNARRLPSGDYAGNSRALGTPPMMVRRSVAMSCTTSSTTSLRILV